MSIQSTLKIAIDYNFRLGNKGRFMAKAGENEADFRRTFVEKFGAGILNGKRQYEFKFPDYEKVVTSVDETIALPDGRLILVEVDSGNMAKLLAGHYALLNGLCKADRNQTLFLVVHYYVDRSNNNKPYTAHRTMKNLHAIQSFAPGTNWLPYNAINMEDMRVVIAESRDIIDFAAHIWPAPLIPAAPASLLLGTPASLIPAPPSSLAAVV